MTSRGRAPYPFGYVMEFRRAGRTDRIMLIGLGAAAGYGAAVALTPQLGGQQRGGYVLVSLRALLENWKVVSPVEDVE